MAHGDPTAELSIDEKTRVNAAVADAEESTGLEFCVIVGSKPQEDARYEAERAFHKLGMHDRPAVMIMVVPHARTLEVVTAPDISDRISDLDCDESVRLMTGLFAMGDIVGGLERGVLHLAEQAGPRHDGASGHVGVDLPNIVDLDVTDPGAADPDSKG